MQMYAGDDSVAGNGPVNIPVHVKSLLDFSSDEKGFVNMSANWQSVDAYCIEASLQAYISLIHSRLMR